MTFQPSLFLAAFALANVALLGACGTESEPRSSTGAATDSTEAALLEHLCGLGLEFSANEGSDEEGSDPTNIESATIAGAVLLSDRVECGVDSGADLAAIGGELLVDRLRQVGPIAYEGTEPNIGCNEAALASGECVENDATSTPERYVYSCLRTASFEVNAGSEGLGTVDLVAFYLSDEEAAYALFLRDSATPIATSTFNPDYSAEATQSWQTCN